MADKGEEEEEEEDKEKPEHFNRMTYLVVTIGTDIVRQLFVKDIPTGQSVGTFLKNNERKIKLLQRKRVFNDYQLHLLNSSKPDVNKFDISLLYILVCNFSNMNSPIGGWDQAMPLLHDTSPAALLMKLKTARNEIIAHSSNGKMTKSSFEKHWSVTSDILIDLAGAISQDEKRAVKEKVDEMRKKPIGDEVYKQNTLVMWTLQDRVGVMSSELDKLSKKMATQETQTGSTVTTVHTLQGQMAAIHKEMTTLNTKMATQETCTGSIDKTVHALQVQMATLDTKIVTQGGQTVTSVQTLTDQMATLDTKMATQETHTGSIDTTVHALHVQMATILNEMGTLNTKIATQGGHTVTSVQTLTHQIATLDTKITTQGQQTETVMDQLKKLEIDKLHAKVEELSKTPQRRLCTDVEQDKINNLQQELKDHYRLNSCCKMAIPALIKGKKTDVSEVFVMPSMRVVKPEACKVPPNKDVENEPIIRSIHELFMADGKPTRNVYIRGEAGTGKTTLCQKIVSLWCDVHKGHQTETDTDVGQQTETDKAEGQQTETDEFKDKEFLKKIELLLYIPLRYHKTSEIAEMIKKANIVRDVFYNDLKVVLENGCRSCLIIFDGLDEWPSQDSRHKVPWIDPRNKFFVLTTSRPWKLEILRPEMSDFGQIELCGPEQDNLTEAVVRLLNNRFHRDVDWRSFKYQKNFKYSTKKYYWKVTNTYRKVKHLADIPVILTQIVCMWYDGEDIKQTTRIHIFCQMVEYLLGVAHKRSQEMKEPTLMMGTQKSTNADLANIFKGYDLCGMHSETLFRLSDLAYHTLISSEKEKSLVFTHSVTEIYKLTENDLKFCLNVGLLSQSEVYGKAATDLKCVSFLHKTFQELFAALFVVCVEKDRSHINLLQTMETLEDVFEMSEVLIFLSGLRPDLIGDISSHIAELTDRDDRVLGYRNSLRTGSYIIRRVQGIISNCLFEAPTNSTLDCKVELHDIYNTSVLNRVLPNLNKKKIKSLTYVNRFTAFDGTYKLSDSKYEIGHNLVMLNVDTVVADVAPIVSVIERSASSLSVVRVSFRPNTVINAMQHFLKALYNVSHLKCFGLAYTELTHSCLEVLCRFLSASTHLEKISIESITCTTCTGQCSYTVDLSQHKHLQYLNIEDLDGDFILSNDTPLEHCEIVSVTCESSIINRLRSSTSLQTLVVCDNWLPYYTDSTTRGLQTQGMVTSVPLGLFKVVTEVTPTLINLRSLCLYCIDFKQDILRLSPEMTSLEEVGLADITMTLQCVQGFIDTLPQTELEVIMHGVAVSPSKELSTAVKYITDRHQVTEFLPNTGLTIGRRFNITFTNRPSSCK